MKWERKKIKDTGKIVTGKTPPTGNKDFFDGEYLFVTPTDLDFNNYYIYQTKTTISEVGKSRHVNQFLPANSVMYTCIGNTIGKIALNKNDCLTNQQINSIIPNDNHDFKFLYYYLISITPLIKNLGGGVATPIVNKSKFEDIDITIPKLPTQRKIASILSAYDDLIENNLKRIKLLEEKAFASYKLIVQNEKLEEFTIDELANVVMGQSPTSDTYTNEKEDNLPFHQGVTNFSNYFVEHKIYCKAPIKIAEEGDILFSVRAPVGRINFTSDKICIGRGLCAFRSKKGFQNYFYHQLKEFFFAEDVIGNGAIFNAVTKIELMKVKLKTPNEKIQQEFEAEALQIYNLILNLTKQNSKLREARDILLPRLMNGQIEV